RLCNLVMEPGRYFLINRPLQFVLIRQRAIHSIKAVVDTAHWMPGQEIPAIFRLDDFPFLINPNRAVHGIAPFSGGPVICGCIRLPLVHSRLRLVHRNRLAAECPADTLPRADGGRLPQTARPTHLPALAVHIAFPNPGATADTGSKQKSTAARSHEAAVLWFCALIFGE